MPRHRLNRGDEVSVELMTGYKRHGTVLGLSDEWLRIRGTVGDTIGHEIFIDRDKIVQVERLKYGDGDSDEEGL